MGTLVGGSSTIGTAQLAFDYGISAWWFTLGGGVGAYFAELYHQRYFHLFARGVGKDADAGLSLLLGVLCTQSYAQAFLSDKTDAAARRGALHRRGGYRGGPLLLARTVLVAEGSAWYNK